MSQSLGLLLKKNRETSNISIDEIAKKLNVKKRDIDALEHDNFAQITKHLYLTGLIKSYAKILKIKDYEIEEKIKELGQESGFECNTKNKKHQLVNLDKEDLKNPTADNIINAILILMMIYLLQISFDQFRVRNLTITDLIINNIERM